MTALHIKILRFGGGVLFLWGCFVESNATRDSMWIGATYLLAVAILEQGDRMWRCVAFKVLGDKEVKGED